MGEASKPVPGFPGPREKDPAAWEKPPSYPEPRAVGEPWSPGSRARVKSLPDDSKVLFGMWSSGSNPFKMRVKVGSRVTVVRDVDKTHVLIEETTKEPKRGGTKPTPFKFRKDHLQLLGSYEPKETVPKDGFLHRCFT